MDGTNEKKNFLFVQHAILFQCLVFLRRLLLWISIVIFRFVSFCCCCCCYIVPCVCIFLSFKIFFYVHVCVLIIVNTKLNNNYRSVPWKSENEKSRPRESHTYKIIITIFLVGLISILWLSFIHSFIQKLIV